MHCRDIEHGVGYFHILPNRSLHHVGAFVRINGPTIDTISFQRSRGHSAWIANYSACTPGNYSASVHIYLQDHDPEAVLRRESCVDPALDTPTMFHWAETGTGSSTCPSVWSWADQSNAHELSQFRMPVRPDYVAAYAGLRSPVAAFNFTAHLEASPASF